MKKFIQKIFTFIMTLWHKGKEFVNDNIAPAMDFVEKLKEIVNSPAADAAVKLFPGTWDDLALQWLRQSLPTASDLVGIVATCTTIDDPAGFIQCIADEIKKRPESQRPGLYRDLAAYLSLEKATVESYEHDLEFTDVAFAIELNYLKEYKKPV